MLYDRVILVSLMLLCFGMAQGRNVWTLEPSAGISLISCDIASGCVGPVFIGGLESRFYPRNHPMCAGMYCSAAMQYGIDFNHYPILFSVCALCEYMIFENDVVEVFFGTAIGLTGISQGGLPRCWQPCVFPRAGVAFMKRFRVAFEYRLCSGYVYMPALRLGYCF